MGAPVARVLVGTDGSTAAAQGVSWAGQIACALDAQVLVASAVAPDVDADERSRLAALLDGPWSSPARAAAAPVSTAVLEGDARVALLDAVTEHEADLLVLGSAGSGWYPALHLGHVAHAVAHHSPVPLVVVPPGAPVEVPGRIMVGVDGSAGGSAAVGWTATLGAALGAEVFAVHAHMRALGGEPPASAAALEERCRQWTAPLRSAGLEEHVVLAQGWPGSVLVALETLEGADLVVVGARGTGGFRDLRLGSVALQVLQRSAVPVAVVPADWERG